MSHANDKPYGGGEGCAARYALRQAVQDGDLGAARQLLDDDPRSVHRRPGPLARRRALGSKDLTRVIAKFLKRKLLSQPDQ